ncbi:porin family protein [Shewanella submarina]|uniref:Porin family protein n=1 Tax=Shewanella submarina TaxID=2016376 RepID=A0ABV7GCU1_9GAMM|nr:porin family protein [Shewanella submarina]MCL1039532.1 porin family protein [Shewanella submarina]
MVKSGVTAVLISILTMGAAHASESNHIIGGSVGYGALEYDNRNDDVYDGGDGVALDLWYRYMLSDDWGVELGYMGGEGGYFRGIWDPISSIRNLQYSGARASVYRAFPIYSDGSLYGKVGYGLFDIDYDLNKVPQHSHDQGFVGAFGFEHRFSDQFGVNAEYQLIPLGDLTVFNINLGLSWRF